MKAFINSFINSLISLVVASAMILSFQIQTVLASTANEYSIFRLPHYKVYTYYTTASTNSAAVSPISNAMATWTSIYPSIMRMGCISATNKPIRTDDAYNTIGSELHYTSYHNLGGSATSVATNIVQYPSSSEILYSDIILNIDNYNFNSSGYSSNAYYDYQGIFTHELGHTWGLDDINSTSATSVNDLPTMYGGIQFNSINPSLHLRSLQDGDRNGYAEVKRRKGW